MITFQARYGLRREIHAAKGVAKNMAAHDDPTPHSSIQYTPTLANHLQPGFLWASRLLLFSHAIVGNDFDNDALEIDGEPALQLFCTQFARSPCLARS